MSRLNDYTQRIGVAESVPEYEKIIKELEQYLQQCGMTEVAADIIHYDCKKLYFYIYDRAGIIRNPPSFLRTYEETDVSGKKVRMIIYNHTDI